jgi:hypothetical protein
LTRKNLQNFLKPHVDENHLMVSTRSLYRGTGVPTRANLSKPHKASHSPQQSIAFPSIQVVKETLLIKDFNRVKALLLLVVIGQTLFIEPAARKQILEQKPTTERGQIPVLKNHAIHHVSILPEAAPSVRLALNELRSFGLTVNPAN